MAENTPQKIDQSFESYIRKRYTHYPENESQKIIIGIQNFILNSNRYRTTLRDLLDFSARTIYRLFGFKEISIGIRDQNDDSYKYMTVFGFISEAEKVQRATKYKLDEYWDYENYPGIKLSSMSDYCIADVMKDAYNRPSKLSEPRKSLDEFQEGDYINISIYDSHLQLIGWMELANPLDGKIPTNETLIWIELFASILGILIEREFLALNALKNKF